MMQHLLLPIVVLICLPLAALSADSAPADKSGHHLFKPVPRELMRELSTDRPDQTESPYTVDAGHFQLEMDFVNTTIDRDRSGGGDLQTEVLGYAPVNIKVGLLNNVDIQFVLDTYVHARATDAVAGTVAEASGFGDMQTRLKINLWGNDGGPTALAIMPFVKWPLSQSSLRNGRTEGGVIVPLAVALPRGWGMGLMSECDFVRNAANDGYDTEFVNSITFGHDLIGDLGAYAEFLSAVSTASNSDWQGQAALGLTYGLTEDMQLDVGCNFGVTDAAPDSNPFLGFTVRF